MGKFINIKSIESASARKGGHTNKATMIQQITFNIYSRFSIALLSITICLTCASINAQVTIQHGIAEEYQGAKAKTPLEGVSIYAGGATARSGSNGRFKLEFKELKLGDKVNVNLDNVATLNGYILFNKDALEQWFVSGKGTYFHIVLCKKKKFDDLVRTYYNVSDKSYKEQLRKERAKAAELMRKGEIQQAEYEQLLQEANERYDLAFKTIKENAETVARIDESELDDEQKEILRLARTGNLDEAVELIYDGKALEAFERASRKIEYHERKIDEANDERTRALASMKNDIKVLRLRGGKHAFELCEKYWLKIIESDTTDLLNLVEGARFFAKQNKFPIAERYYLAAIAHCKQLGENHPEVAQLYVQLQNELGGLYHNIGEDKRSDTCFINAYKTIKPLVERDSDTYNPLLAKTLLGWGQLFELYTDSSNAETLLEALEIFKNLAEKNPDEYTFDYANTYICLGNLCYYYSDYNWLNYDPFLRALKIIKPYVQKKPDIYKPLYAKVLYITGENSCSPKDIENLMESLRIMENLVAHNPDAYNPDYAYLLYRLGDRFAKCPSLTDWNYDNSLKYYLKALSVFNTLTEQNPKVHKPNHIELLLDLGRTYHSRNNDCSNAEKCYFSALELAKSSAENDTFYINLTADIYGYLGHLYHFCNDQNEKALQYYFEELNIIKPLAEQNPEMYNQSLALSTENIGSLYDEMGNYELAQYYLLQSDSLYKIKVKKDSSWNNSYADLLTELGKLYTHTGKYQKAEEYYLQSFEIYKDYPKYDPINYDFDDWNPFSDFPLCDLLFTAICNQDFALAENFAQKAKEEESDDDDTFSYYIISILLQGRCDEAINKFNSNYQEKEQNFEKKTKYQSYVKKFRKLFLEALRSFEDRNVIPEERKADVERLKQAIIH